MVPTAGPEPPFSRMMATDTVGLLNGAKAVISL